MKRLELILVILSILAFAQVGQAADLEASESDAQVTVKASAGTWILLSKKAVTAVFPDFFYIQEQDRSAGIRVDKAGHTVKQGDIVSISGQIQRNSSGERFIAADEVTIIKSNTEIKPLGINNTNLGGWSWRWIKTADNTWVQVWLPFPALASGLFIRTWGHVTQTDPLGTYLIIDDGSRLSDYAKTQTGVKVQCASPVDPSRYPVGTFVAVNGACGQYLDEVKDDPRPIILIPNSDSIRIIPTD